MRQPNRINEQALESMPLDTLKAYAGSLAVQLTDLKIFKDAVDKELARRDQSQLVAASS